MAQSVGFVGDEFHDDGGRIPRCTVTPMPITIDINVSGLTAPSDGETGRT